MQEMQEIIQDFINESSEILQGLDNKFVEMERAPGDLQLLNDIFRSIHTIKGAAGFLGFKQLVEVAHATESILNKLRQGEMKLDPAITDVVLEAVDFIRLLLGNIRDNNQREEDLTGITGRLSYILQESPLQALLPPPAAEGEEIIRTVEGQGEGAVRVQADQAIRVDTKRLDDILNLVGELVLGRNRLIKLNSMVEGTDWGMAAVFTEVACHIDLITSDLQLAVMKTRMQPVGKVFGRFPRMVRDLSRISNKEIELELTGEETEVDKSVVEEIGDPLIHLIRNAVDHGIEPPEEREKAGKPRKGRLRLSACHEGDHIIIEVSDDGKGINTEGIKAKAVERGLLQESDVGKMEDRELLDLIFLPGFSTAMSVTDVSGRGVGMDVVKTNISRLNGSIDIESRPGLGTTFSIKLPLTMAIIQALIVGVGSEVFAVPLSNVLEAIRADPAEFHRVEGTEVMNLRKSVLPVIRLSERFNLPSEETGRCYIVVVRFNERNYGILVDRLIGQEEVVIKPLDECMRSVEDISGATITGDGKVILILNIAKMMRKLLDERMGKK